MKIPYSALPKVRLTVLVAFFSLCTVFFGYLWVNSGGRIPGISSNGYQAAINLSDVDNLVQESDVVIAGVKVGKVREVQSREGAARIVMNLKNEVAPLHEGATVRVRNKTLVEETYLEIADGTGQALPDGVTLPDQAARPSVQLNDVLASLDPPTREALGSTIRSLGTATEGRREDVSRTLTGLGKLGRQGNDALDALAAQSEDLKKLVPQTTVLLQALDTRRGQIATLVEDANRLTQATASGSGDIEAAMRQLPEVVASAQAASTNLTELSHALQPVAKDLDTASPDLSRALQELPATARDLRGLLPALNGTLDAAPNTLQRVPVVSRDVKSIIPPARVVLADLNPSLAYLNPYGRDIAAFFSNVSSQFAQRDVNGHYLRVFAIFNEQTVRNSPLNTNKGLLDKSNAYPQPGQAANPGPFAGPYTRIPQEPR
ncbi:MlaD family protein [Saccharopolyspora sp. NPDC049426]|uniref:MlaD family protein n=1 Tax=Saccharopolyspora sp. NPDC049426 TaxID=3155652 RepID=UPI00343B38D1